MLPILKFLGDPIYVRKVVRLSLHTGKVAHQAREYPGFFSMKRLWGNYEAAMSITRQQEPPHTTIQQQQLKKQTRETIVGTLFCKQMFERFPIRQNSTSLKKISQ